jgi:trk system potassium uptake protein TrkA
MNIVIIGDGKIGHSLAEQLVKEKHHITLVDTNAEKLNESAAILDINTIRGNGASMETQIQAHIPSSDLIIAVTSSDEVNMICCLLAKKLGAEKTVARIRNPEYSDVMNIFEDELGLNMTVNPELYTATEISRLLRFPAALRISSFVNGRIDLIEFKVKENNPLIGNCLKSICKYTSAKIIICVIERDGEVIIPNGETQIRQNDKIHITGAHTEIQRFLRSIGGYEQKVKSVIVIGGGRISFYLAKIFERSGMYMTIIEQNMDICHKLSENLSDSNISIIHGDGTDQETLYSEGFKNVDAFVSLTDIDEENIVASVCAIEQNIKKVITKINRMNYMSILNKIGIETVVSPKIITADHILRYVRALQSTKKTSVNILYKIADNNAEALEFMIDNKMHYLNVPIQDMPVKKNIIIANIVRKDKVIFPNGKDHILPKDHVVVVTTNSGINDINDIFIN